MPRVRTGMPDPKLDESTFKRRYREQFTDPAFDSLQDEIDRLADAAWDGYANSRKSPRTAKAGAEFADPDNDLSVDWLAARQALKDAQARHDRAELPRRILIINGSARSDHTCPGAMSKSSRLSVMARRVLEEEFRFDIEVLDLSRLGSEYGRKIHPCKACFSTAAALCHWPCSRYPNHSLGQTQDWMNEIYPMWVAAHGIMVVSPVNWYQVSSPLRSEEHTSELQSLRHLVCRLLLEKKKKKKTNVTQQES